MAADDARSVAGALALSDPERTLVALHAPRGARAAMTALFALDERLAQVLRTTTQPLIGQMRLTWWHDALGSLGGVALPAEPLLIALTGAGLTGRDGLATIVEGWEALLEEPLDADALAAHATARGSTLFGLVAAKANSPPPLGLDAAGATWALTDVARHMSDPLMAATALDLARTALARAPDHWPRRLRCLGMLTVLARRDVERDELEPPGSRGRIAAMVWHRISGRG